MDIIGLGTCTWTTWTCLAYFCAHGRHWHRFVHMDNIGRWTSLAFVRETFCFHSSHACSTTILARCVCRLGLFVGLCLSRWGALAPSLMLAVVHFMCPAMDSVCDRCQMQLSCTRRGYAYLRYHVRESKHTGFTSIMCIICTCHVYCRTISIALYVHKKLPPLIYIHRHAMSAISDTMYPTCEKSCVIAARVMLCMWMSRMLHAYHMYVSCVTSASCVSHGSRCIDMPWCHQWYDVSDMWKVMCDSGTCQLFVNVSNVSCVSYVCIMCNIRIMCITWIMCVMFVICIM